VEFRYRLVPMGRPSASLNLVRLCVERVRLRSRDFFRRHLQPAPHRVLPPHRHTCQHVSSIFEVTRFGRLLLRADRHDRFGHVGFSPLPSTFGGAYLQPHRWSTQHCALTAISLMIRFFLVFLLVVARISDSFFGFAIMIIRRPSFLRLI
jgi:hypothetical protein